MAQKRMFDRDIISSDSFTEMSSDAQNLYFHLGIHADDEGFVSPKGIMRMISSSEDSLKILKAKQFVIPFDSGVVVITDWKTNNWLDSRRIKPTKYQKEKELLNVGEGNKYTLSGGLASALHPPRQYRVEESSVEESRIEENRTDSDVPSREFSLKREIQKLEESPRRDLNIIALYLDERKPDIQSSEQLSVAIKRHLRAAKELVPFTDNQILNAVPKAKSLTQGWVLETVVKVLTK